MNDPIGDMLTRIRNGQMRGKSTVSTPASKLRGWVLDVLSDEGIRQAAKTFSQWPTFPQVYIRGEFGWLIDRVQKAVDEAYAAGYLGKNTLAIVPGRGSWFFLGAIFTTLELEPDAAETDHCGSCRRCLDICPTDAFPAPYRLDARLCISYLTIEHKGPVDEALRPKLGNRIYGCDDCLAVCPWNKFAQTAREAALHPRPEATGPALKDLVKIDDSGFREVFTGSPVKRTGRDRFVRNVLIAIGNSQDASLLGQVEARLDDAAPLVRGAAVWALWRLAPAREFLAQARARADREMDEDVRAEWATCAALCETRGPTTDD